jgi:beta-lactamase superfamily II metal-dependent hydrolase
MDAGQGDTILVVFPDGSLMLVDCGCKKNENVVGTEMGKVLQAYLKSTGNHLHALILTHSDGDHCNLIEKLILENDVTIGTFMYGGTQDEYAGKFSFSALKKQVQGKTYDFVKKYFAAAIDKDLSFDGKGKAPDVDVRILAANLGDKKPNDASVVLLLTCGKINIFLMGDAEKKTEKFIMKKIDKVPALKEIIEEGTTVLKVGHHGSNTSSTQDWIDYIKPQTVLISSDTKEFGPTGVSLPRSEIISRFTDVYDRAWKKELHNYIQYNSKSQKHEMVSTTEWLFTTLHYLVFKKKTDIHGNKLFIAYGTSWHYETDGKDEWVAPACDWQNVNKAY